LPLHGACRGGNPDIVSFFLSKDSRVNFVDSDGFSPLDIAAAYGFVNCVKLLLSVAEFDDVSKQFAVVEAAASGHVGVLAAVAELSCDLKAAAASGVTPLLAAVANSHLPVVRFLVEKGADVADGGLFYQACASQNHPILRHLMAQPGLDAQKRGFGTELLKDAIASGNRELIDVLLDGG
jgi:ankyrin repeat protein